MNSPFGTVWTMTSSGIVSFGKLSFRSCIVFAGGMSGTGSCVFRSNA